MTTPSNHTPQCPDPRELVVYITTRHQLAFGAGHPDLVPWLEATFSGIWRYDEDDRPLYVVPGLRMHTERTVIVEEARP